MKANPSIDGKLLEQAMQVSGESSESAVLTKALEEYIKRRSPKRVLELCGKHAYGSDSQVTRYTAFGPNRPEQTKVFLQLVSSS